MRNGKRGRDTAATTQLMLEEKLVPELGFSLPLSSSKYGVLPVTSQSISAAPLSQCQSRGPQLVPCTDQVITSTVYTAIQSIWGIEHLRLSNLPCSNPKSLMKVDIDRLHRDDYHVGLKTNGVRMFLYMGQCEIHASTTPSTTPSTVVGVPQGGEAMTDDKRASVTETSRPISDAESGGSCQPHHLQTEIIPFAVLIDRAFKMYSVDLEVNPEYRDMYFRGTLFDGELLTSNVQSPHPQVLVRGEGSDLFVPTGVSEQDEVSTNKRGEAVVELMEYILFDAICVGGKSVKSEKFSQRIEHVNSAFNDMTTMTNGRKIRFMNGIVPRVKKWFRGMSSSVVTTRFMERSVIELYTESHFQNTCDGLIFVSEDGVLCAGTQQDTFKWKPGSEHTVDFLWDARRAKLFLGGHEQGFVSASQLNIVVDPVARLHTPPLAHRTILECSVIWSLEQQVWVATPVCIRDDKKKPNNINIAALTLRNISEALTLNEVFIL
jgi:hypothetical protein